MEKKKIKKYTFTESSHQIAIINYANYRKLSIHYRLGDFLIKIHNEGKKSIIKGARDKKLGIKAGVSDLFLAIPNDKYHGMWIEVKSKDGKLSKKQQEWFDKMIKMNYYTCVVYDVNDFIKEIDNYIIC